MRTILPVLTAAALIALAGPALAGKSTPQEREITKQLNLEQAQQAKNTTQQIAAAAPGANTKSPGAAPEAAATTPIESAPAAGQSQPSAADTSLGNAGAANADAGQQGQ